MQYIRFALTYLRSVIRPRSLDAAIDCGVASTLSAWGALAVPYLLPSGLVADIVFMLLFSVAVLGAIAACLYEN